MNLLPLLRWLIPPAVLLPMLVTVLFGLMGLLSVIGDEQGVAMVRAFGWLCLVLWIVNLAALAIGAAVILVGDEGREDHL